MKTRMKTARTERVETLTAKERSEALASISRTRHKEPMKRAMQARIMGATLRDAAAAVGLKTHQDVAKNLDRLGLTKLGNRAAMAKLQSSGSFAPRYARHVAALRRSA